MYIQYVENPSLEELKLAYNELDSMRSDVFHRDLELQSLAQKIGKKYLQKDDRIPRHILELLALKIGERFQTIQLNNHSTNS